MTHERKQPPFQLKVLLTSSLREAIGKSGLSRWLFNIQIFVCGFLPNKWNLTLFPRLEHPLHFGPPSSQNSYNQYLRRQRLSCIDEPTDPDGRFLPSLGFMELYTEFQLIV